MLEIVKDGQRLCQLSAGEWDQLVRTGAFQGHPLSQVSVSIIAENLHYARRYPELSAFMLNLDNRFFLPWIFLQVGGYEQRVNLERLTCPRCVWRGLTAEPLLYDNYLGLPTEIARALLQTAASFPVVDCPLCHARLPRHPIWAAYQRRCP